MFWQKKFKNISDYGDDWQILEGRLTDRPIFTRCRTGLIDAIGHPKYPFEIGVAVPLFNPTSDGLPTNAEAQELHKIEDELVKVLEERHEAIHTNTITYNSMREFVFYASEWKPEYFEQKVKRIQVDSSLSKGHQLQFMMQPDKEWKTFREHSVVA